MNKEIIGGARIGTYQLANSVLGKQNVEFVMITDDLSKPILVTLLKKYTVYIETKDRRLIAGTYKNLKIIGKTESDVILIYDLLSEKEVVVKIEEIRIVRVMK